MNEEYCVVCEELIADMDVAVEVNDGPDGVAYVCADCWANRPDAPPQWVGVQAASVSDYAAYAEELETQAETWQIKTGPADCWDDDNEPY